MRFLVAALSILLAGCASMGPATPSDRFMASLAGLCGQAFQGRIVSLAVPADASFAGQRLVMHVRQCEEGAVRIPFHVGEDRSRTWVVSRTSTGLRLKHDHRHEDGSEDRVTQYGGDTVDAGTAERQVFPADAFTRDLLVRENNPAGAANIWAMEVRPGATFAYELPRPGRFFRVEFDLTRPVALPSPPWGSR